jgi:hypothetical protein
MQMMMRDVKLQFKTIPISDSMQSKNKQMPETMLPFGERKEEERSTVLQDQRARRTWLDGAQGGNSTSSKI